MYLATMEGRVSDRSVNLNIACSIWPSYFPDEEFAVENQKFKMVVEMADFFSSPQADHILSKVQDNGGLFYLPVDFLQLRKVCGIERFYVYMREAPKDALLCMGAAVHLTLLLKVKDYQVEDIDMINVRLYNHHDSMITLKNLKAAYIGKLVSVRGTVVKEILKSGAHEEGRVPRTVDCELSLDLVDSCIPGDIVTVTGIIKVINNYMDIGGGKSKNKNQGLYYLYLEAISVRNSKSQTVCEDSEIKDTILRDVHTFSAKDLEFIVKFLEEHGSDTFRQIIQSFCPSIYGHELVKAGITLGLFGGVQKHSMNENKVPVRGDIHVIIVGDPGLGKSQLLQAAAAVSPRGIYVCGNATTNAGLTVAVVKDHMTSDYAFEAGAMVLADHGLCCIDEFDKMSAEHQALLEAMEQQSVSVAKAGLVASLSARTSVLAAANPVGGHYNRAKTVNENLKMSAALLSRFDLVFILLDKPDELLDKRVSDHIMALHTGNVESLHPTKKLRREMGSSGAIEFGIKSGSLASRLRLDPEKDKDFVPLPGPLLRKYISYARAFIFPRMSRTAAEILQKFYLKLRDHNTSADGTPITARQLESLVRLAEARARLELREEITTQDALEVVEIMKESLYDKYVDEHGFVDFARSGGMSQQKEAKRFLSALNKQSELLQKDCFSISVSIFSLPFVIITAESVHCYLQAVATIRCGFSPGSLVLFTIASVSSHSLLQPHSILEYKRMLLL
ncbi:DNA replication licensing factor MCM3 like 1 [Apostasia shenzhenica]|uniref:DNA helicase n=1 Tax=Apostasia shenzhenica TaxID=1088818 RepID=A0A2I0B6A3_9ASPA|nr:DNA replication licensing factor MCM3 like 1 [Apostasia shenzhenica]